MQKDYIIRMVEQVVEQFIQMLSVIIPLRKSENYKEARSQVHIAAKYLFRMDMDLLLLHSDNWILENLKNFSNQLDTQKCVLSADLFYELALIEEAEKKTEAALRLKILCLHFYTIAIPKEKQFQTPQYFEKISKLTEELVDYSLPQNILECLSTYQGFLLELKDK